MDGFASLHNRKADIFFSKSEEAETEEAEDLNHSSLSGGHQADTQEKPTKKKRKRCGECTGCQRKDNCGDCAPCRNEKSHQICKVRRCDRLTEKKVGDQRLLVISQTAEDKI